MKKGLIVTISIIVFIGGAIWGWFMFFAPQGPPPDRSGIITEIMLMIDDPYAFFDGERVLIDPENPLIRPIIYEGRTMLPLRFIAESFGMEIDWVEETRTINLSVQDMAIALTIGEPMAVAGGRDVELDVPAMLLDDRTMIPLRFIAEEMNCEVDFNEETFEVRITFLDVELSEAEREARRQLVEDRSTAAALSRAAALMVANDPLYHSDLMDFSSEVIIALEIIRPYLRNPDMDLSVINTGIAPWIVSVREGIFTVTDSSIPRQIFFEGAWSNITPPPPEGEEYEEEEYEEYSEEEYDPIPTVTYTPIPTPPPLD